MIVELHMLQNFAPSCLNRDDTNSPKECEFGGVRRARISSQCLKRSIRQSFKQDNLVPRENLSSRTKGLVPELEKRLMEVGKPEEEAHTATVNAINSMGKLKLKEKDRTEYLLFLGEKEITSFRDHIIENWGSLTSEEKLPDTIGKGMLKIFSGGQASDLGLFGRMLANLPEENIDAACQVAHAVSTHKVGLEFDFYTAVDDFSLKDETGAGMMGTIEYNSACFYRYSNIDTRQLMENLGGDWSLVKKTIDAFIQASVNAIPTGKQNSFAAQNHPSLVFATVRDNGFWSLANAFSRPVRTGPETDLIKDSVDALLGYWGRLNDVYGSKGIREAAGYSLEGHDLGNIHNATSLEGLMERVNAALNHAQEV